ncbi:MAG TPA: histidine phosphatase family protein [Gaiellaceae bacterium]|nr:histidine phosphatase family protein [Gaiellaceae bacterium]
MTTIYLARHGESDWNAELRWQGHADRPLTERGRRQAAELADRLADVVLAALYSSDLERARATARIVAEARRMDVVVLPELREIDVGSWSGLTRAEAEERFPAAYRRWADGAQGWDDGETYEQMTERVVRAILNIAQAHPGDSVLVVAHGGPIRALHATALGIDLAAHRKIRPVEPNARLSRVAVENGRIARLD